MIRSALVSLVQSAVGSLVSSGSLPVSVREVPVEVEPPKQADHGDFATNFCLVAAKVAGLNPRALAEMLAAEIQIADAAESGRILSGIEIAGPGFVNFRLDPAWAARFVGKVLNDSEGFYRLTSANPQKINVEFVSVNPNGPITIGSGRGAAFGSALCNVLEAAGNQVCREYYINDGVNSEQMRLFAESVKAIIEGRPVPENGYKGDYVHEVAQGLAQLSDKPLDEIRMACQLAMVAAQESALTTFQTNFDTWFSEQSLHDSGAVQQELDHLIQSGVADEEPTRTKVIFAKGGAVKEVEIEDQPVDEEDSEGMQKTVWLRSTKFGDDQDRVLRRKDGRLTYIASDVAYHKDKFNRPANADKLITVLGPDHHGYIARLTAVVAAMHADQAAPIDNPEPLDAYQAPIYDSIEERNRCRASLAWAKEHLEVQIFQIVRFLKDGKPAPMRKRDGNIYALIDLVNEIGETLRPNGTLIEKQRAGTDVARFFYLMRHHDTAMDFDLELATKQSDENPVFYVQYAHARICSVIDKAAAEFPGQSWAIDGVGLEGFDPSRLTHPKETALILKVCDLQNEVARTTEDYSVNRIATYAVELARTYHGFYDSCRVIQPDQPELSRARLALCSATRAALQGALRLLGVSAPERMDRPV